MNKIKLLYDVVMTMKEKEDVKGTLKVEGKRDQVSFLSFNYDFDKNAHFHRLHGHHHNHCFDHAKMGVKEKLSRLAYVLSIFNSIKTEEKEDKSVTLSLNLKDIPEDMKQAFHERMKHGDSHEHDEFHEKHCFMKEFSAMEKSNVEISIKINSSNEVEKVIFTAEGKQKDETGKEQEMNLKAELNFTW